jgi:hypothetical protein
MNILKSLKMDKNHILIQWGLNEKISMSDIKLYNSSNEVIYSLNENWKNIN